MAPDKWLVLCRSFPPTLFSRKKNDLLISQTTDQPPLAQMFTCQWNTRSTVERPTVTQEVCSSKAPPSCPCTISASLSPWEGRSVQINSVLALRQANPKLQPALDNVAHLLPRNAAALLSVKMPQRCSDKRCCYYWQAASHSSPEHSTKEAEWMGRIVRSSGWCEKEKKKKSYVATMIDQEETKCVNFTKQNFYTVFWVFCLGWRISGRQSLKAWLRDCY